MWFYAWWYAGAIVADMFHVSPMLGPIVGVAAAALFVSDPRKIIWSGRRMERASNTNTTANTNTI